MRREELVNKIKSNLEEKVTIPVAFGFPGLAVQQTPYLWVVEHSETSALSTSGSYVRTLEVSVEYFDTVSDNIEDTLQQARQMLLTIREAVETARFYFSWVKVMTEVENSINVLPNNIYNLGVLYSFEYVDNFKGPWRQREFS